MAKTDKKTEAKTAEEYQDEIRQMIIECKGECKAWYMLRIRSLAMNLVILDKVQNEILAAKGLILQKQGSTGQIKSEVNPLLPYYNQLQNTVLKQFNGLGLNIDDGTSADEAPTTDTTDPMEQLYRESKNILENNKK
jgi:hypothetical protein